MDRFSCNLQEFLEAITTRTFYLRGCWGQPALRRAAPSGDVGHSAREDHAQREHPTGQGNQRYSRGVCGGG